MMPPLITVGSSPPASSSAGDQRGGGGLAVRAGDGDAAFQPHQLGQHLGAPHHRQALRARGDQFGIVALDGGGHHHHVGAVEVLGLVADGDLDALVAQALDVGAVGDVRAVHGVAEIGQHLGDAAHADAADADEVDRADVARQFHEACPLQAAVTPWQPCLQATRSACAETAGVCAARQAHQIGEPVGGVDGAGASRRSHGGSRPARRPAPRFPPPAGRA